MFGWKEPMTKIHDRTRSHKKSDVRDPDRCDSLSGSESGSENDDSNDGGCDSIVYTIMNPRE